MKLTVVPNQGIVDIIGDKLNEIDTSIRQIKDEFIQLSQEVEVDVDEKVLEAVDSALNSLNEAQDSQDCLGQDVEHAESTVADISNSYSDTSMKIEEAQDFLSEVL